MTVEMLPQYVTRFYGVADYAMDVIKNKQIAFVHVATLNDPFDPYCFFETDFGDSYENLTAFVEKHHPGDLSWFKVRVTPASWAQTVSDLEEFMQKVRQTTFVLSTSAVHSGLHPRDNLYMWGHYANGHRGLAFEFDTQALARAVLKHHEDKNGKPLLESDVWSAIEYTKTFSPITAECVYEFMKQENELLEGRVAVRSPTQLDKYYGRMPKIKSDVWQSENEWRLMWHNDKTDEKVYKCPIDEDTITSIFLGLNFAVESGDEIVSAARHNFPAASIFRARKRLGDLAPEFREV